MAENWHTLAGRLRWAIRQQPPRGKERGLRLFQRRIEKRPDTPGTSLSAIQSYLRGDAEPSLRFVHEAARLLAVRPEWLAWGVGAPTEEEEVGRRESPEAELSRISTSVYEAMGVPTVIHETETPRFWGSAAWAPVVRQTSLRLYQRRPLWGLMALPGEEPDEGWTREYADADGRWAAAIDEVAAALAAPLHALQIEPSRLSLTDVADYVQAVALALQRVIHQYNPDSSEQDGGDDGDEA